MVSCVVNRRHKPASALQRALPGPGSRPLFPHPFVFSSLFRRQTSANSNNSRTSRKFARKSNHSRTCAKTGGWGLWRALSATSDQRSGSKDKAHPSSALPGSPLATRHSSRATKSNYSRTCAKQGVPSRKRLSPVTHLFSIAALTIELSL